MPRLRRLFDNKNKWKTVAEDALAKLCHVQRSLVIKITADHNVLNEVCESRNNHRYAVVVQDLATQWIQSYPCKTKNFSGNKGAWQKFLEPDRKPKVIYTDNSLGIWQNPVKILSWSHRTSTPHRSETNGIAERAIRRVKEGTFVFFAPVKDWMMVRFYGMLLLSAKRSRLLG